jgi:nitrogen fixation protein NifB
LGKNGLDQKQLGCPGSEPLEREGWDPGHLRRIQEHPCYSPKAAHTFGRIHLPVAPKCNIQCNYCVRDFDCVHESRPGVTSRVISPQEALDRASEVIERFPNIKVIGIAGPGEPLYNDETFETFRLIKGKFPGLHHCVSSNGLLLVDKLDELVEVGVSNITVTLNTLKPEIGEKIYSFITRSGKTYRGREGAQLLIQNQLAGIEEAAKRGITVKVNTVMIPGINDQYILDIAQKARELGAYMHNIMPLIPQYLLAHVAPPSPEARKRIQDECAKIIPQMKHCRQCRADAVGKLGEDMSQTIYRVKTRCSVNDAPGPEKEIEGDKVRVAVATTGSSGTVDLHFGHTRRFSIYEVEAKTLSTQFLEERMVEEGYCKGPECDLPVGQETLLQHIVDLLKDCKFLLTRKIGYGPAKVLEGAGIKPVISTDTIENAIQKILH